MKILCLIRSLTLGGAERQMIGLAEELTAAGHELCLGVYRKGNYYEGNGLKCVFIEKKGGSLSSAIAAYIRDNGIELVIAFLPGPCKKACIAHMVYPHFKLIVSERNLNLAMLPHDSVRFNLYRQADRVIANSRAQERFIKEKCPWLREKLGCIVNFAPVETLLPFDGVRPVEPPPTFVVTARLCPRKNPVGLIKAAALLKKEGRDFVIKWYGAKANAYARRCWRLIDRLGLAGYVQLLPPEKNIATVYRHSDFFCLPSFYEGTSNSLAEAMCCGLPVVCTAVSDSPLYVKDGKNGFLCKVGSAVSLKKAMDKMLDISALQRKEFGLRSRQIAVENFGRGRFAENWEQEIEKL